MLLPVFRGEACCALLPFFMGETMSHFELLFRII
jgi:hypothetical protein